MRTGERIRAARKELGCTQEELSKATGLPRRRIVQYERGIVKDIPHDSLKILAERLNKSVDWLLGRDETPQLSPAAAVLNEIIAPPYNALTKKQIAALRTFFSEYKLQTEKRDTVEPGGVKHLTPKQREAALKERLVEARIHRLPELEVREKVAAGTGEFIEVPPQRLLLSQHRWKQDYRPFKIVGDSMAPFIMDGDFVVVDVKREPVDGDTVIARIDSGLAVKRYYRKKDRIELASVNPEYGSVEITEVAILGIVIDVVRPVKKITY